MNSGMFVSLNTGQTMPKIGFGTAHADGDVIRNAVNVALECGYRSIDTAFLYFNEAVIGDELHEWFSSGKLKRSDVFVTTKLPCQGNRFKDVARFLMISLERLKLDYLDMYLIHCPIGFHCNSSSEVDTFPGSLGKPNFDFETDLEELWRGMEEQVFAGRVKSIGVSNFNIEQIERIMKVAKIPPALNQIEVHCYLQQPDLIKKCKELGIAVEAYSPLGAPYIGHISPPLLENPTIKEIAKRHGKTSGQIALNFLLHQDLIIIPKSITPERIKANFQVFDFTLSDEEIASLKSLDQGEHGRIYHFRQLYPGCEEHKEYPFPKNT